MSNQQTTDPFVLQSSIKWGTLGFFILMHLLPISLIWLGVRANDLLAAFVLYLLMGFGVTAGYHRYFAHKTFQTNRVVQFLFAVLGSLTFQRIFPWAATHRHHHRTSDTERDFHSPIRGFLWAHLFWMFPARDYKAMVATVPDLTRFPELRWINTWCYLVPLTAISICYALGGWSMVVGGYVVGVLVTWHITLSINSLAHLIGSRRYVTTDTSRNSFLLALLAFGEGWHNNHHHYATSTRQGFRWWEIDMSYYLLRLLSLFSIVRNLRSIPKELLVRNLVADGTFDIGESLARAQREKFLAQPRLLPKVLAHTLTIAGATALLSLLVVFASLQGNVNLIVGSSIFGTTLLAFFILHIWKFGVSRNNLYLLMAGATTPLILLMGRLTPWAWGVLAIMWTLVGLVILARMLKVKLPSLEITSHILMLATAAVTTMTFWQLGSIDSSALTFLIAGVGVFAFAYRYRRAFEILRVQPVFQLVLLAGSTSYFFFLSSLII